MREFAAWFYKSVAWRECRQAYLKSVDGLCERCLNKGIITKAEVVHHIIHLEPENIHNKDITLGADNLMAVCRKCHGELHEEMPKARWDEFGRCSLPER